MPCGPSSSSCAVPDQAKGRKTKKKGRKRAKTESSSSSSSKEAEANASDVNVSPPPPHPVVGKYPSVPPPAAAAKSRKTKKKRGKTKKKRGKTEPSSHTTCPWLKGKKKEETTTTRSSIYDPAIHRQLHAVYDVEYRKEYCKQLRATSAFDVTVSPPVGKYSPYGWVIPIPDLHGNSKIAKSRRIVLNFSADFALQQYNSLHNGNYVFKELVKATMKGTMGLYYFITFLAEDATHDECGGGVKTFQAAVLRFIGEIKVWYCELKTEPSSSSSSKEAAQPTPPYHPPTNIHDDNDKPYGPSFFDVDFRKEYFKQLKLTDAFDVNVLPKDRNNLPCCYIFPVPDLHVTSTRILLEYLAKKALDDYRMDRLGDYDFKKLVKANARGCGGVEYYITFLGEDATKGVKTFQAAVLYEKGKAEVWYCKLKATN